MPPAKAGYLCSAGNFKANQMKEQDFMINICWIRQIVLAGSYFYLALPFMIFLLGWCRLPVGIPAALVIAASVAGCLREQRSHQQNEQARASGGHGNEQARVTAIHWKKLAVITVFLLAWTWLSGIGGFVWQNGDHYFRNTMFSLLVEEKWPLVRQVATDAGIEVRGMVYYIGYWLPSAMVGKLFGMRAGRVAQCVWALAGITLVYALICLRRKKLAVWPLVLIIFFSGMDVLGVRLGTSQELQIFGETHLEHWLPCYQFSSMTTQLFWVFNQAVPAWVLCALVFLGETPKNLVFLCTLLILTATFPFVGLIPFICYFMVSRCQWDSWKDCWNNWCSLQNIAGGAAAVLFGGIYILGNYAVRDSLAFLNSDRRILILIGGMAVAIAFSGIIAVLLMRGWGGMLFKLVVVLGVVLFAVRLCHLPYGDGKSPVFYWLRLTFFYMVEAGAFFIVLYPCVRDKKLFYLNAVWLYVIPLILVGRADDFCMRASIPGLFLLMLWCIEALEKGYENKEKWRVWALVLLLGIGAVTPLHEMKRSFVNTCNDYAYQSVEGDRIFQIGNFSGSTEGFFWRWIAKKNY